METDIKILQIFQGFCFYIVPDSLIIKEECICLAGTLITSLMISCCKSDF